MSLWTGSPCQASMGSPSKSLRMIPSDGLPSVLRQTGTEHLRLPSNGKPIGACHLKPGTGTSSHFKLNLMFRQTGNPTVFSTVDREARALVFRAFGRAASQSSIGRAVPYASFGRTAELLRLSSPGPDGQALQAALRP